MKPEHITAWALNEVSDDDRARIEAEMKESHSLLEQVQETQAFCDLLTQTLGAEKGGLTDEQRDALLAQVPQPVAARPELKVLPSPAVNGHHSPLAQAVKKKPSGGRKVLVIGLSAAAACWAAYVGVSMMPGRFEPVSESQLALKNEYRVQSEQERIAVRKQDKDSQRRAGAPQQALKPVDPALAGVDELQDLSKALKDQASLGASNTYTGGTTVAGVELKLEEVQKRQRAFQAGIVTVGGVVGGLSDDARDASIVGRPLLGQVVAQSATKAAPASGQPVSPDLGFNLGVGYDSTAAVTGDYVNVPVIANPTGRGDVALAEPVAFAKPTPENSTERYALLSENSFQEVAREPLSTFGVDVDSASYANVRRFLNEGRLPPPEAVRLEEMINYFPYSYEPPAKDAAQPFSVQVDMAEAPWAPDHRLARVAIKGREIGMGRQQANLVFLVDVSGSMEAANKLALVKRSLRMLTEQLKETDYVSIVTYAGSTEVKLTSTPGKGKASIAAMIDALQSGGSTNGAAGIQLAYAEAQKHFIQEGINRVILCTDGDFNVGVSSPEELERLIKEKAESRVFLSVLGFGTGNLQDRTMMTLADKGNGNYAYIDSLSEARKVLVEQMNGTLVTIAKDVKIQVEFNPAVVRSYRLIGYEKRALAKEDFNNDRKDAGEIGAGHTVTALYEVVPVGAPWPNDRPLVDELKYQPKDGKKELPMIAAKAPLQPLAGLNDEVMTVKLRYKAPDGDLSKLIEVPVKDAKAKLRDASKDFQFATAVAGFGLMLRDSQFRGGLSWEKVRGLAIQGKGEDPLGYRGEFIQLIDKANGLSGRP